VIRGSRLLVMFVVAFGAATIAGAQPARATTQSRAGDCNLELRESREPGARPTSFVQFQTSAGNTNDFMGGSVNARCTNTDQRLISDSLEHFGDQRVVYLIGNVHYTEGRVDLTADRMTYYLAEERLIAEGNVVGRTSSGTRFRGPRALYLRAKQGVRDRSRLDAGGRPDLWISAADAGTDSARSRDSTHVLADSVISDNDSLVYARGSVVIERPDLVATSDSAMIDQGTERAALRRNPVVKGKGERPFDLSGTEIDIYSRQRKAERVRSNGNASAKSDDMSLKSDSIELRIIEDKLSRAIAWGPGRSMATQVGREITADSIDVRMPGESIESITAVKRARAESIPDSTKIFSKQRDWFSGDTIRATFDTSTVRDASAKRDTAAKATIKQLTATGSARSWQQAARDGVTTPDSLPAVNYMGGRVIDVTFNPDRSLGRVRVTDQAFGVLVQPASDTARKAPAPVRTAPPLAVRVRP
jgi:lipopolysaccharide export system protein LptA